MDEQRFEQGFDEAVAQMIQEGLLTARALDGTMLDAEAYASVKGPEKDLVVLTLTAKGQGERLKLQNRTN